MHARSTELCQITYWSIPGLSLSALWMILFRRTCSPGTGTSWNVVPRAWFECALRRPPEKEAYLSRLAQLGIEPETARFALLGENDDGLGTFGDQQELRFDGYRG